MSNRADNKVLHHHDTERQARRLKLTAVGAKIKWVGTIHQSDREKLLRAVKTHVPANK